MPDTQGEANRGCKYGEAKAREIIRLLAIAKASTKVSKNGRGKALSMQKIANRVGVSVGLVEAIKNGRKWRSLTQSK